MAETFDKKSLMMSTHQWLTDKAKELGLSVSSSDTKDFLADKILAYYRDNSEPEPEPEPEPTPTPETNTEPEPTPEPEPEPEPVKKAKAKPKKEAVIETPLPDSGRVWLKIMPGANDTDKHDVFASINGDSILIKRNHWVKVKKQFVEVFDGAMQTEFELSSDNQLVERKVPRFNYQVRQIEKGVSPDKSRPV